MAENFKPSTLGNYCFSEKNQVSYQNNSLPQVYYGLGVRLARVALSARISPITL